MTSWNALMQHFSKNGGGAVVLVTKSIFGFGSKLTTEICFMACCHQAFSKTVCRSMTY